MDGLILAAQLILSLSILVVLHELGHFLPAKLFKTKVEKFYLFFDPWFSLFKVKKGETEYGIGWLPLGGYVKIAGMIDESMDKEAMKQEPQPWEFRSKPAWQRLIIMIGGVTVNLILGIAIYAMVLFVWGKEQIPTQNVVYGVHCDSLLYQYGFQDGDIVLKVGEEKPQYFSEISKTVLLDKPESLTVLRQNQEVKIPLGEDFTSVLLDNNIKQMFIPRVPFVVDSIVPNMPAAKSDLQKGDSIIGINKVQSPFFSDITKEVRKNKGGEVQLHVIRKGEHIELPISVSEEGQIGVSNKTLDKFIAVEKQQYGFFEAIPAGITTGLETLSSYASSMKLLFTASGAKQVGSFISMGSLYDPSWNWEIFWNVTALLSIILAFMNILPIPALDGGHIMFLIYEMVAGRKPSDKFMEVAQTVGMVILLGVMVLALGNDIIRNVFN